MESALALVSMCSEFPEDRVEKMYRKACESEDFVRDQFEYEDAEEDEQEVPVPLQKAATECENLLEEVRNAKNMNDTTCENVEQIQSETAREFEDLPDKDDLLMILEGRNPEEPFGSEVGNSPDSSKKKLDVLPDTLKEALALPGNKWNTLLRLMVRMRHTFGGSDTGFLKNARNCRKAASGLNWYQPLSIV